MNSNRFMRKYRISIIALIIAVLITSYFIYVSIVWSKGSTVSFSMDSSISVPENDTSFNNLFFSTYVNDSLPYYEYRRIEDSLKRIRSAKELDNKSVGSGQRFGSLGFFNIKINRDPMIYDFSETDSLLQLKEEKLYYLSLDGYNLNYENKFFVQNGKFYLAIVKWDSVVKRKYDSTTVGHYQRKEIKVRYATDNQRILIPISKKKYNSFESALTIFLFISIFFLIYIFIGLPIQILVDISKGRAFTKENIRRFKLMAFVLFFCTFLKVFSPYILDFFYRKMIPKEFRLEPVSSAIISNIYLFLIALVLFFVGKAFQRGYNLQQEQDLTI